MGTTALRSRCCASSNEMVDVKGRITDLQEVRVQGSRFSASGDDPRPEP
jgi:hypothetical protein